ncbi:MAG: dCTP deaminase [Gammaproteobacteria bacterium]|jgi:dCTP deaminase|nr:dCTP deaminase [Gammaproteobacteria bacterium]
MALKEDRWIRKMALEHDMISPFVDRQISKFSEKKIISYGLSSYGYDVRCTDEFKIFTNALAGNGVVDPKAFSNDCFISVKKDICIIPPNSFVLTRTLEYFKIPRDVLVICLGKSTYARCGIIVNVTPLEPEWEGHITLEFSNTTNLPAYLYAGEGVAQLVFLQANEACEVSYKDRLGKYMGQLGITDPVV